jgi:hypothetical protein
VELGVHLPLMEFGDEGQSLGRILSTAEAARDLGFAAVSANDHFVFQTPWLDGPTALAAVVDRTGAMDLATTVALVTLRGPAALAKTLAGLEVLAGGRVVAGVGPGSSERDYELAGVPYEDRWRRFEEATVSLRTQLKPTGIPIWLASWGSPAGLRRVARLGDGWFASAYNTTPERFEENRKVLPDGFPNGLVTMWTWITEDPASGRRSTAPGCSRATRRPAAGACTCGRSATSRASSSSRRRRCFPRSPRSPRARSRAPGARAG